MRIEFQVTGDAVPQPRQRHRIVRTKAGRDKFANLTANGAGTIAYARQAFEAAEDEAFRVAFIQNYTTASDPVNAFKDAVRLTFKTARPPGFELLDGPVRLSTLFVFARPKSRTWKKKAMPRDWGHKVRADVDNLMKAIMDALNKLAWTDDRRVCAAPPLKVIAAGDEQPHVEIVIEELENVTPPAPGEDWSEQHDPS